MNTEHEISVPEFENIERYLLHGMEGEELKAFEQSLTDDPILRKKLAEIRLLLLGVKEAELSDKLNEFHNNLLAKKKDAPVKPLTIPRILMAAAMIIIVSMGAWLYFLKMSDEEKLFTRFYKPDPGLISAMSVSDNYTFDRAMIDYKVGSYDSALVAWQGLLASNAGSDTLHYFIGCSYLALDNNEKAISAFKTVTASDNSYFKNDAYWYIGLALIKEGKIEEAIPYIEKSDRSQKQALLESLKK